MRLFQRLFFICVGAVALLYGVENFRVNDVPKTFTMEEVEREGVGDARYIIVTGAQSTGRYGLIKSSWTHDPNSKTTTGVVIPLYSERRIVAADEDDALPPTSLVYKMESYKGCVTDDTCGAAGPVEVRGVVRSGSLMLLRSDDYANHYPHAANFIYVAAGEPLPKPASLLFALVGGGLILMSLMPRRKFDRYVTGRYR